VFSVTSGNLPAGSTVQVSLPSGVQYQTFVSGTGSLGNALTYTSGTRVPVFTAATGGLSGEVFTLKFLKNAVCGVSTTTSLADTARFYSFPAGPSIASFNGQTYNVSVPVFTLVAPAPVLNANVGVTYNRCISISNSGNGSSNDFWYVDSALNGNISFGSAITIAPLSGGTPVPVPASNVTITGNKLVVHLTAAELVNITHISNPTGITNPGDPSGLDKFEALQLCYTVTPTGCGVGNSMLDGGTTLNSQLWVYAGCGPSDCITINPRSSTSISIGIKRPVLDGGIIKYSYPCFNTNNDTLVWRLYNSTTATDTARGLRLYVHSASRWTGLSTNQANINEREIDLRNNILTNTPTSVGYVPVSSLVAGSLEIRLAKPGNAGSWTPLVEDSVLNWSAAWATTGACVSGNPGLMYFNYPALAPGDTLFVRVKANWCWPTGCAKPGSRYVLFNNYGLRYDYTTICGGYTSPGTGRGANNPTAYGQELRYNQSITAPQQVGPSQTGTVAIRNTTGGEWSTAPQFFYQDANTLRPGQDSLEIEINLDPTKLAFCNPAAGLTMFNNAEGLMSGAGSGIRVVSTSPSQIILRQAFSSLNSILAANWGTSEFCVKGVCGTSGPGMLTSRVSVLRNCGQVALLGCDTAYIDVSCPPVTPCTEGGMSQTLFRPVRGNYGLADADNNKAPDGTRVNEDNPLVRSNYLTWGDTLKVISEGVVIGGTAGTFTVVGLQVDLGATYAPLFSAVSGGEIQYRPVSGPVVTQPIGIPLTQTGNSWTVEVPSSVLSLPSFAAGDTVRLVVYLKNTEPVLPQVYGGVNGYIASSAPYQKSIEPAQTIYLATTSGGARYTCNTTRNSFFLTAPTYFSGLAPMTTNCNGFNTAGAVSKYFALNGADIFSGHGGRQDLFRYEYRPDIVRMDSLRFIVPSWVTLDSVRLRVNWAGSSNDINTRYYNTLNITNQLVSSPYATNRTMFSYQTDHYFNNVPVPAGMGSMPDEGQWGYELYVYGKNACSIPETLLTDGNGRRYFNFVDSSEITFVSQNGTRFNVRQYANNAAGTNVQYTVSQPGFTATTVGVPAIVNVLSNVMRIPVSFVNTSAGTNTNNVWVKVYRSNGTAFPAANIYVDTVSQGTLSSQVNGYFRIGNLSGVIPKMAWLNIKLDNCTLDSVMIVTGFDCSGYKDIDGQVCTNQTLVVRYQPYVGDVQLVYTSLASTPVDPANPAGALFGATTINMCDNIPVELKISSVNQAAINNIVATIDLPLSATGGRGMDYVAGSGYIEYRVQTPRTSATVRPFAVTPVYVNGGTSLQIKLDDVDPTRFNANTGLGLQGTLELDPAGNTILSAFDSSEVIIHLLLRPNCDFVAGTDISAYVTANTVCNRPAASSPVQAQGPVINLAASNPKPFNAVINSSNVTVQGCNGSGRINAQVLLSSGTTTATDSLHIVIPAGYIYNGSSLCTGCQSPSGPIVTSTAAGTTVLSWGLTAGNTSSFNAWAEVDVTTSTVCSSNEFTVYTTFADSRSCGPVPCTNARSTSASSNAFINIQKPTITLNLLGRNIMGGNVNVSYSVTNSSAITSGLVTVKLYADADNNGIADGAALCSQMIGVVNAGTTYTGLLVCANTQGLSNSSRVFLEISPADGNCICTAARTGNVTLPLNISKEQVKSVNCASVLSWESLEEDDNKVYIIQRSTNAVDFETIGEVQARGKAGVYTFTDPLTTNGLVYYRIKVTSHSGNYIYSRILRSSVNCDRNAVTLNLYPNPVTDGLLYITINSAVDDEGVVSVLDVAGKEVMNRKVILRKGISVINLNASSLADGSYLIKFKFNKNEFDAQKIIKQ